MSTSANKDKVKKKKTKIGEGKKVKELTSAFEKKAEKPKKDSAVAKKMQAEHDEMITLNNELLASDPFTRVMAFQKVTEGKDKTWKNTSNGLIKAILAAAKKINATNSDLEEKSGVGNSTTRNRTRAEIANDTTLPGKKDVPFELIQGVELAIKEVRPGTVEAFLHFCTKKGLVCNGTTHVNHTDPVNHKSDYNKLLKFAKIERSDEAVLFVGECVKMLALRADYPKFIKAYDKAFVKFVSSTAEKQVNLGTLERKALVKLHNKYWRNGEMVPLKKVIKG